MAYIPDKVGEWNTVSFSWQPPFAAKSFKILFYSDKTTIASLYFDNVKVNEMTRTYQTNGNGVKTRMVTSGTIITLSSIDYSNPAVTVQHKYEFNINSPNVKYICTLSYKKSVKVKEERLDFIVPTKEARVMTRDLNLTDFDTTREYYSDYYAPKVVRFNSGLSFLANDSMQSMRLRVNGTNSQLSFYADSELNHPFSYYIKNGEGVQSNISAQTRSIGDNYSVSLTFSIDPATTHNYLVKARQPDGYDAVLVLTNHADCETTARINAVAYGTEDTASPDYGSKGIVGRGLGWTKSVFLSGQVSPYGDLSKADFKALTDKLSKDGVELVGHSITDGTDNREIVENGLHKLAQYGARNWIDHGASAGIGNWEDLASQGSIKDSDNYILDLLDKNGYLYAWSYIDYPKKENDLNLLSPSITDAITPFFYANNNIDNNPYDNKIIYLWCTINTQKKVDLYYAPANIDKLISERGMHIGHEYMGNQMSQNHAWYINPVTGMSDIFPAFDAELAYIASKRDAGLLWTPNMSELGNYLALLAKVSIEYVSDNTFKVINNNTQAINSITLIAENTIKSVILNGHPLESPEGSFNGNEIVLVELSPVEIVTLGISY